jgi:carboxylesterase type B
MRMLLPAMLVFLAYTVILVPALSTLDRRATVSSLNVTDGAATYMGTCTGAVCSWKGIRYAKAPVGQYRFAAAQPVGKQSGVFDATAYGAMCLQNGGGTQSEDCLFANVFRPSTSSLMKKLPVLLFVHGGGFQSGSGSNVDPTAMVTSGAGNSLPAVVITINYRLGLFGFLGGTYMYSKQKSNPKDVSLNAGFTDVRQALSWVRAHAEAFGGDPAQVTLWGQSAGSFAAAAQMLGSPDSPRFAAVILESGSPGGVPVDKPSAKDDQYNSVVSSASCSGATDSIACLRQVDAASLLQISSDQAALNGDASTVPRGYYSWTMVQDGGAQYKGFYADRPSVLIKRNAFANVPVLHGDCYDEGTFFAYQGSSTDLQTIEYFKRIYFNGASNDLINEIFSLYPDIPAQGSPFIPFNGDYDNRFYGPLNQYKRIAALYGDIRYQANRRFFLEAIAKRGQRAYSYEFAQYTKPNDDSLGYPHGSDLNYIFNVQSNNPFKDALTRQWLSFATYRTPNKAGLSAKQAAHWYQYTTKRKSVQYYANATITNIDDSFRAQQFALLNRADVLKVTGR